MRLLLAVTFFCLLADLAAAQTALNPFVAAYGRDTSVTQAEIHYRDGVLPSYQDSAAADYAAHVFDQQRRDTFNAFAEPRGLSAQTAGERMAEYLAEADLGARMAAQHGSRHLKIVVTVTHVNAPSMISVLLPMTRIIPTIDADFTIADADSGVQLATGRFTDVFSLADNSEDAARRLDLHYNWSGTDQHFRTLAGQANALVGSVDSVLTADQFPTGRAHIGDAPLPGGAIVPLRTPYGEFQIAVTAPQPAPSPVQ